MAAVEAKQVAQQEAERARFIVERVSLERPASVFLDMLLCISRMYLCMYQNIRVVRDLH